MYIYNVYHMSHFDIVLFALKDIKNSGFQVGRNLSQVRTDKKKLVFQANFENLS